MEARRNLLPRLLAGLEAGILGGLAILAWFLLLSSWNFRAPWALVNLFSASLRNSASWGYNFSALTWTGLAGHLFVCGLLGMFIGYVLPRPRGSMRISLPGLAFGFILSLLVYEYFWRRYVPLLNDYVAPAAVVIVHLVFGMCLAQFPRFYLSLEPEPVLPAAPIELPNPDPPADHDPAQPQPVTPPAEPPAPTSPEEP